MQLQTKRLILRAWRESDAGALYKYARNPNIGPIAGWPVHTSVGNSREIIKNVLSADETYAVVLKTTGEAVGSVGLMIGGKSNLEIKADEAETGYWIGEPLWGQGLIPEAMREIVRYAFDVLNLSVLWCGYFDGNEKSKRVSEKCGFTFHHTEYDKEWPLIGAVKTQHITRIAKKEWQDSFCKMNRYLEEKDMDNCLALMELVKDDFAGYKENEFIQAMHHAIAQKEAFVVYDNKEIAGLIAFSYKNREITFLAVNPKSRRKGIAKNLIREVINCFRPGDMLHVVTFRSNDPKGKAAVACYRSCGFLEGESVKVYGYPCQKMILWL